MEDNVSIQEIFHTLKKRLLLILSVTIGAIVAAALISYYLLTPVYQSSTQFIVIEQQNDNSTVNLNNLEANVQIINTYHEIIKSPLILEQVKEELNLNTTLTELGKKVEVVSSENSQVVTVSVIDEDPQVATTLANTIVDKFKITIPTIMRVDNVHVLSRANVAFAQEPIKPRPVLNIIIAAVIGLATSVGSALLYEFLNTRVMGEQDIEQLGIPVLGVISKFDNKGKRKKTKPRTRPISEGGESI